MVECAWDKNAMMLNEWFDPKHPKSTSKCCATQLHDEDIGHKGVQKNKGPFMLRDVCLRLCVCELKRCFNNISCFYNNSHIYMVSSLTHQIKTEGPTTRSFNQDEFRIGLNSFVLWWQLEITDRISCRIALLLKSQLRQVFLASRC